MLSTLQPHIKNVVWSSPLSLAATQGISLIYFPLLTKMFQFSRYRLIRLCIQRIMIDD